MNPSQLTLCAVYSDLPTAAIALGALRSDGIEAILDNGTMGTVLPPAGGIRLMVHAENLDAARDILAKGGLLD
ncbi:MAG: DUF2007 domain-containing protein [Muribaculaceae bacterium]|nr:DUF2007 domain-containing protein [Muribaculaceae bacterium]